jgi:hypothetical protein
MMSNVPSPHPVCQPNPQRRRRPPNQWLIVSSVLALFAAVLAIAGRDLFLEPAPPASSERSQTVRAPRSKFLADHPPRSDRETFPDVNSGPDESALVDDDGQTLWMSPTAGQPLDLGFLPPGVQLIFAIRPQSLARHPEGEKVLAALGPAGEQGMHDVEQTTGVPFRDMDRLTIGCQIDHAGNWSTTLVASLYEPVSSEQLRAKTGNATDGRRADQPYFVSGDRAKFFPGSHDGKLLVVAPVSSITEIIDLGGNPPPLRRDLERLVQHTDADRQMTLIVAPEFLFGEGRGMFSGELTRLREPLFWFLGDEFSAAAISLHWDENFFAELIAVPTLDTRPERAAEILAERVARIPDEIEDYVVGLDPSPYSRHVISRFPGMVRKLFLYTRGGFDPDHAALRCYLPVIAGHNMLMGAELTLAESPSRTDAASGSSSLIQPVVVTARDRLRHPTSLRFSRDTLEAALDQLSKDIGVEIILLGADLQLEGITKNQSFGINLQNLPAEEVLVEILRLANPDKSATGPNDPRQKLVYVVKPEKSDGPDVVLVTTRSRAAERGDTLPAVFVTPRE